MILLEKIEKKVFEVFEIHPKFHLGTFILVFPIFDLQNFETVISNFFVSNFLFKSLKSNFSRCSETSSGPSRRRVGT